MISILVSLLLLGVFLSILWMVLDWLFTKFKIDGAVKNILFAIIGFAALIYVVGALGYLPGWARG